ncbi:MAG: DNA gyrase inhibitor YacG [Archangiaceae bacterium]|nr:DNA gyrase inhibitor YacG [Archangiaceae bacterium]
MAAAKCPTCKRDVLPRPQNPSFPFCSARCRAVDLGKWLGEEFRVADRTVDEDEDGLRGVPGDGTTEEPN